MQSPKASFVIPSHNCAAWLAPAIKSVLACATEGIEIVVVDDASTDSTPVLMRHLLKENGNIVYHRNEKNLGRSASRNLGNSIADGDCIFVLDADDLAYPNRVRTSLEKLKKADFVYGAADVIDAVGHITGKNQADVYDFERTKKTLLNFITHSTCAYSRDVAEAIKYREGKLADLGLDDWAFELEAFCHGFKFDHIPTVIGAYRQLSSGISKTRDEDAVRKAKEEFFSGLGVKA